MFKILINTLKIFLIVCLSLKSFCQNDVTQFLDIPVDGYKSDMIQKLKSKGYTLVSNEDYLIGEFNGTNVSLSFSTNNNKIWRIIAIESNDSDEINIKIKFNNLINQFAENQRYIVEEDTTLAKFIIPKNEDISYQMLVKKKRYEAVFYQKTLKYDSLIKEKELLLSKEKLSEKDKDRLIELMVDIVYEKIQSFNKRVWFTISNDKYDKYYISIFYENLYNKAKGEGL